MEKNPSPNKHGPALRNWNVRTGRNYIKTRCLAALQEQRGCSYTEVTDDKSFTAWAAANPIYVDCHQDCTAALAGYSADLHRADATEEEKKHTFLTRSCQVSWLRMTKTFLRLGGGGAEVEIDTKEVKK